MICLMSVSWFAGGVWVFVPRPLVELVIFPLRVVVVSVEFPFPSLVRLGSSTVEVCNPPCGAYRSVYYVVDYYVESL
jgi:hypothetical protein